MLTSSVSKCGGQAAGVFFLCLLTANKVGAQTDKPPAMLGQIAPFQVADLPQQSQLRQQLNVLPEVQKARAMAWLHSFSFPQSDLASLQIDREGGVFYKETNTPKPGRILPPVFSSVTSNPALAVDVFHLHSRPASANKVFLDFDGHDITGTAWNEYIETYNASGYDIDQNPGNFSNEERARIAEIWHRIAEDYAPFDIDVTTEEPEAFGPTIGRVLFTRDTDRNGYDMPARGGGGVAYVNVWGTSEYADYYSPALVYYNKLGQGYPPYMAEAGSHELGHNLGLSHDGVTDSSQNINCTNLYEYYCGLGWGYTSWAPIMGASYYANVTQWSKGDYPSANNTQDDVNIIKTKLNFRPDDIKNSYPEATQLLVEPDGSIQSTNPENDPGNSDKVNKGIIETGSDKDIFWFTAGKGPLTIHVNPAWDAFYRGDLRGANLDIRASLYKENGALVVYDDPADETYASLSASVEAGRYYLIIRGVGNNLTPYPAYASTGEYFISGQITPPVVVDQTPPNPNPMTWQSKPYAQSRTQIVMKATTATDDSGGPVQYRFRCVSSAAGCVSSGWQSGSSYVAGGLTPGTSYSFNVVARDQTGNQTSASPTAIVSTLSNRLPVLTNDASDVAIFDLAMLDAATFKIQVKLPAQLTVPVLANDSDPDGDTLTITSVGPAKYGIVSVNGSNISYKPKNGGSLIFENTAAMTNFFNGDTFSYTVSDGHGGIKTASVTIKPSVKNAL